METLTRFRLLTVRLSLMATGLVALGVYSAGPDLAKAVLAGGIGGTLAFWIVAYRTEKLANAGENPAESLNYRWTFARLLLYAGVLVWAYRLEPERPWSMLAATGGLFIVRLVAVVLGLTGLDLKREEGSADGEHR